MTKNQIKNIKSGDIIVYSSRNFAYLVLEYLKYGHFNVIFYSGGKLRVEERIK